MWRRFGADLPKARRPERIALLTDFGVGPYVGQIRLLLAAACPRIPVVELISDLPAFRPDLAAYLLPGLRRGMPQQTLYLCVVDPGVGTDRGVLAARIGPDWLLAPDNGLLLPLLRLSQAPTELWRVTWRPRDSSATFHGRDVFTPIAARLVAGSVPAALRVDTEALIGAEMPSTRAAVCYVDHYGNLMTGLPADEIADTAVIRGGPTSVRRARTFSDVAVGDAFWYENAFGLVEIAINQGRAADRLGLRPGDAIAVGG